PEAAGTGNAPGAVGNAPPPASGRSALTQTEPLPVCEPRPHIAAVRCAWPRGESITCAGCCSRRRRDEAPAEAGTSLAAWGRRGLDAACRVGLDAVLGLTVGVAGSLGVVQEPEPLAALVVPVHRTGRK